MQKPWYLSKTLWTNALMGIAAIVWPRFGEMMTPEVLAGLFVAVNIVLRVISDGKITLS